jgi:hypothetical protein
MASSRTNLRRVVIKADPDYEREKSNETEYEFVKEGATPLLRTFKGRTDIRGPYADE